MPTSGPQQQRDVAEARMTKLYGAPTGEGVRSPSAVFARLGCHANGAQCTRGWVGFQLPSGVTMRVNG